MWYVFYRNYMHFNRFVGKFCNLPTISKLCRDFVQMNNYYCRLSKLLLRLKCCCYFRQLNFASCCYAQ